MNDRIENGKKKQEICIQSRESVLLSGVNDVICFDENRILLETVCGELAVEGEGLKVGLLDTEHGSVSATGRIDSVYYTGKNDGGGKKKNLFGRLFG